MKYFDFDSKLDIAVTVPDADEIVLLNNETLRSASLSSEMHHNARIAMGDISRDFVQAGHLGTLQVSRHQERFDVFFD